VKLALKLISILLAFAPLLSLSQTTDVSHDAHLMTTLEELEWQDPALHKILLPKGLKVALLHGNPNVPGKPFTMLINHPDGWRVPPHRHPVDENLTVLKGVWRMGMGETYDENRARALTPGSHAFMPAGTPHFAHCKGETIVQIHGIGPFKVILVNPDAPMKDATYRTGAP
jgi:quercetin dioxygenase-like cupin family protein